MGHPLFHSRHLPTVVGAVMAGAWVLLNLDAPLVEDGLFWWVPKAILAAEGRWPLDLHGALPSVIHTDALGHSVVPQWSGGLPDYGHPPLWYGWLGLFIGTAPTIQAIHLACLLPAMAAGGGLAALGARLGHRWSGLAVFAVPPFLAQLVRPELDLGLLALVPWALLALLDRRWNRFGVLAVLAVLTKEPGVLLVAPALALALQERRVRWQALLPLIALLAWGAVLGWLAKPERLPTGPVGYLIDLWTVVEIVFLQQGRWLLLIGLPLLVRNRTILVFVLTWLSFFAAVGFFANRGTADAFTHIRYLLPGMLVAVIAMAGRWPYLAIIGLLWLHIRSPYGPEASMYGVDVARAIGTSGAWIEAQQSDGEVVWVGTHTAASLTQPWAGAVDQPIEHLKVYGMDTPFDAVRPGDIVMEASYGEPTGVLLTGRQRTAIKHWQHHDGYIVAWRIGAVSR